MILTFKVKHGRNFSLELKRAKQIAEFALKTKTQSSKDVKQFGLKSAISNQILREFSRNRRLKRVKNVNLIVPHKSIKRELNKIYIPCLKLYLPITFRTDFLDVRQIELDEEYAYISVTIPEPEIKVVTNYIGVDRNATGHIAVVANPSNGKVFKLGKSAQHTHNKYRNIRRTLQKCGKYGKLKAIKDRESRIVRDINHKISKKIVDIAEASNSGIKLERLKGIRNSRHHGRTFNGTLHSWGFYQLENFIAYKSKMRGIPLVYVEPRNTSKECSRCGDIGARQGKKFVCHHCGHVENADVNASFNIALRPSISRFLADRDVRKGCSDTPKTALARTMSTVEPHGL